MMNICLRMRMLVLATAMNGIVAAGGCATSTWNGAIEQWGAMRSALREGQTQGRVSLADAVARPHAYGVGALEGLSGEVAILDGRCFVAQTDGRGSLTVAHEPGDYRATLLTIAYVPTWSIIPVSHDVEADVLDRYVHDIAVRQGIDPARPFPFVIEGDFTKLHAHVINGECPMADDIGGGPRLYRFDREDACGTLVGIYAENSAGNLTHHDSRTHVHFISSEGPRATAHVERVGIKAGSRIHVPILR